MDEVLKYHRIQGKIRELLKRDKITAADIETESIAVGTYDGYVHIVSLERPSVVTLRPHDRAINSLSMDSYGQILACCADNGSLVIYHLSSEDDKGTTTHFNEPIKTVFVDNDNNPKKDKAVLIGTVSGKLILHKQQWFAQKNKTIFNGAGTPVNAITMRGDIVAWADAKVVRLLNISTLSAICYVSSPPGVDFQNPFPCKFFWESDSELLIGWADSLRKIELKTQPKPSQSTGNNVEELETISTTTADIHMDCILIGMSTFDAEHYVIVGYVPPNEDTEGIDPPLFSATNRPELKIVKRSNGEILCCDVLPMMGQVLQGPWDYTFLSSFMCPHKAKSASRWHVTEVQSLTTSESEQLAKSSLAQHHPVLFLISPEDIVAAKVRDVNDRIGIALQQGDLQLAANLALTDRGSLRNYHFHDIITLYLEDLLDRNEGTVAAAECARLVSTDANLWERWIYVFIKRNLLSEILKYVPVSNPRLPKTIYEFIVESLFVQDSKNFLNTVDKWGRIKPPLYSQETLLSRLETAPNLDPWCLEALAQLYLWNHKYEKALNCYLEINYAQYDDVSPTNLPRTTRSTSDDDVASKYVSNPSSPVKIISDERANFIHVFDLIEKQNLYDATRDKILNLFRLSKELSINLIMRHVEKFPIPQVVKQLKTDKRLLHHFLHTLFIKYDPYNNDPQYAEFHVIQVALYAEFAPNFQRLVPKDSPWVEERTIVGGQERGGFADVITRHNQMQQQVESSVFLSFLKKSKYYPLDYALRECEKRKPPLYHEMVYILDLKGMKREALDLLLREIGDLRLAIDFIEKHEETAQAELWSDLVIHCIQNPVYLSGLLDYLGICHLNAVDVVRSIPSGVKINDLRQKVLRILKQHNFQVFLTDKCNMILEEDALNSLKKLKQGQRRAMKVDPGSRCSLCARPLFTNPESFYLSGSLGSLATESIYSQYKDTDIQVWGRKASTSNNNTLANSVVVFSSRQVFHRQCFEFIVQSISMPPLPSEAP